MKYNPFKEKIRKFALRYFKADGGRTMVLVENVAETSQFYQYYYTDEMVQRVVSKTDFDEMIKNGDSGLTEITKEEAIAKGRKYIDDDGIEREDTLDEADLSRKHFTNLRIQEDRF